MPWCTSSDFLMTLFPLDNPWSIQAEHIPLEKAILFLETEILPARAESSRILHQLLKP